jgi:hypothetical protein
MGNVLTNCPNTGVKFSNISFNDPSGTCPAPVKYIAVGGINNSSADVSLQHKYATSSDGFTWIGKGKGVLEYYAYSIAIGKDDMAKDLLVSVGAGISNRIASSTDGGNTWTGRGNAINNYGAKVKFGRNEFNKFLWVAVGAGTNTIATSTNGTTWSGITGSSNILNTGYGLEYDKSNKLWVAVGQSPNFVIATSKNGREWTGRYGKDFGSMSICYDVAFGKNRYPSWVAVGQKGFLDNAVIISYDGTMWTSDFVTPISAICKGVAFNNDSKVWVVVASNGYITSTNGQTWTTINNVLSGYSKIIYENNLWIAVNDANTINSIATSTDATSTNWTVRDSKIVSVRGIMYNFLPPVVSLQLQLLPSAYRKIIENTNMLTITTDNIPNAIIDTFDSTNGEPIRKIGIIFKNKTNTTDSSYFDDNYQYSLFNYLNSKYYLSMSLEITYGNSIMSTWYQFGNNIIASNVNESIISINKTITDNFTTSNPIFIKKINYSFYLTGNNNTPVVEILNNSTILYLTMNFYL